MPYHSSSDSPTSTEPLVDASWAGRDNDVRELLAQGHDPNIKDDVNCSPLNAATRRGHDNVVKALIEARADPHEVTENAGSLLSITASLSHVETMRVLLAR